MHIQLGSLVVMYRNRVTVLHRMSVYLSVCLCTAPPQIMSRYRLKQISKMSTEPATGAGTRAA